MTDEPVTGGGGFCAAAWAATADLQAAIARHPFNRALADGTLDPGRFAHYLVQDSRYLAVFSTILTEASRQAPDAEDAAFFADGATRALAVEGALHTGYLEHLGLADGGRTVPTSVACRRYTDFLTRTADVGPYPVLVAAVLPCYWIYHHVGTGIWEQTRGRADHPYRRWIDTYADEEFAAAVGRVREIANRLAAAQPPGTVEFMHRVFERASRLEWDFWDSAWRADPVGL